MLARFEHLCLTINDSICHVENHWFITQNDLRVEGQRNPGWSYSHQELQRSEIFCLKKKKNNEF